MKTEPTSESVVASPIADATAGRRILRREGIVAGVSLLCAGLVACVELGSTPTTTAPQTAAAPAPLPPILPFDQAVANAANTVFTAAPAGSYRVVIDPLVDGVTGYGSRATDGIQAQVTDLVQRQYPRFSIEKFSPDALKDSPLVLVGTFTPVNGQNQTDRTARGLSLLPRARRSQDGQGRRQRRRPLPARRRRHHADHCLPRESGMDRRSGHAGLHQHLPGHQGRRSHQQGISRRAQDGVAHQPGRPGLQCRAVSVGIEPLYGGEDVSGGRSAQGLQRHLSHALEAEPGPGSVDRVR